MSPPVYLTSEINNKSRSRLCAAKPADSSESRRPADWKRAGGCDSDTSTRAARRSKSLPKRRQLDQLLAARARRERISAGGSEVTSGSNGRHRSGSQNLFLQRLALSSVSRRKFGALLAERLGCPGCAFRSDTFLNSKGMTTSYSR